MKKLNEDVNITDPAMAQKYAEGMARVAKADAEIAALKSQIARIDGQKSDIQTELAKISGDAAPEAGQNQQSPEQAAAAAAAAVTNVQPTSESLLVRVDETEDESQRIQLEIDQISDQMMVIEDPAEIEEMQSYLRSLVNQLKELDMDQMDHESMYEADDEEPRFTGMYGFPYEVNKEGRPIRKIDPVRSPKQRKQKPWSDTKLDKYDQFDKDITEIEYEITELQEDKEYQLDRFQSPKFEGVEGEMEEFFAQMGHEAADIVNSGVDDKDKLKALKKLGVEDPQGIIDNYYYYYPEFNPALEKPKKEALKEIRIITDKISKLRTKIYKKQEQQEKMGLPVYDSYNPMTPENFYNIDEAYIEREGEVEKKTKEDYLDNDYLFYVKVIDGDNEFIGKVFKLSPDGDWYGIVKKGEDDSFEKISYEPEYDEMDIVEFLGDSYDTIEIIDQHEFNDYIEDTEDIDEEIIGGGGWPSNSVASS